MIPKIIHYCWFGHSPLPEIVQKCIESWRIKMPDYEIKRWDETNVDINGAAFMQEAYALKKYAYVSDYARYKSNWHIVWAHAFPWPPGRRPSGSGSAPR